MHQRILIIGATGMLGKPVTQQLIKDGFEVTIFSTNKAKASKIFPISTIIEGDMQNAESIRNALKGQNSVYMNLAIPTNAKKTDWNPERDGVKTVVTEAKKEGIKRIGYLSSKISGYGNWWVMQDKRSAVKDIKSSGIPYLIFSASVFMDNFNGTQKDRDKINVLGKSKVRMFYIAASDFAKQVSRAFSLENDSSYTFNIQGSEAFTISEAADVFVKNHTKEKLKVRKAPMGLFKFMGLFNRKLSFVANLMEALNNHPEKFDSEETWEKLGKPTLTLKEYAKK